MARLSLSCLGPFQVMLDGHQVTSFKSNKVRALLAYLAVEADRPHHREVLAGLLWPDWPDRDALSNLRYTLSDLRRAVGDRGRAKGRDGDPLFLLVTRDTLQFNSASEHWLDVSEFRRLTAEARLPSAGLESQIESLESAIGLYRGSFLEGFSLGDSPAFEEWTLLTREGLAREMSDALHQLAAIWERRDEYGQAQTVARRQLELEPWDETAHQQLMRVLALSGQRSAALAQYEVCRRLLGNELGVEPGAETARLYEQIRDGEFRITAASAARPPELAAEPPPFLDEEGRGEAERPVFVARERQLAQLDQFLRLALAGQGRIVFVTGEAGSGKTALIQAFARRAQVAQADLIVAGGQGNAHTGVGDPYLLFREALGQLSGDVEAQWAAGVMTREQARRLWHLLPRAVEALVGTGPDLIDLFVPGAPLLERAKAVRPWPLEPAWLDQLEALVTRKATASGLPTLQQSALFEQCTQVLRALAARNPLLLAVDDLQWADGGSLHLLFHLGRRLAGSRILLVGAYRPAEVALGRPSSLPDRQTGGPVHDEMPDRHPLEPIVNELKRTYGDIEVDLEGAAGRPFVDALLDSEPNRLSPAFREALHQRTQGHPLFTVELLRGMQERGDLVLNDEGRWVEGPALDLETLPARVEAVIAERIGRLPQRLRTFLSVASVEGETFTAEVVARVQAADERETVHRLSEILDRRHRLVSAQGIRRLDSQRLSRYRFRHILFQKYLYSTLDPVERAYLHEKVGTTLEGLFPDQDIATVAVHLARHFEEARSPEKAIHYLHQAGERALQLCAYQESITHLTRALALLTALPDSSERARQELALRLSLRIATAGIGHYPPELRAAFARARELGQQTGQAAQVCQALADWSMFHYVRGEYPPARHLAEDSLSHALQAGDPLLVALCHWRLGFILFGLGEYATAREHLEQVIAFYVPDLHHRSLILLSPADAGLSALAYEACCLWCLGYPEQASKTSQKALALAREVGHPFSLADVVCYAGCQFNAMRRDAPALQDQAEELLRLSTEGGLSGWMGRATWHHGEVMVMSGQVQAGIAQIREGIAAEVRVSHLCYTAGALGFLAAAQARAVSPEEGLVTLEEALSLVEETDERHWEAELYRLRAELLLMQGDVAKAEASLNRAIEVARRQQARSWELRATTSLARLWQSQGKLDEARQALADIYGWFTEGLDTPDLQEAGELLEQLGGSWIKP